MNEFQPIDPLLADPEYRARMAAVHGVPLEPCPCELNPVELMERTMEAQREMDALKAAGKPTAPPMSDRERLEASVRAETQRQIDAAKAKAKWRGLNMEAAGKMRNAWTHSPECQSYRRLFAQASTSGSPMPPTNRGHYFDQAIKALIESVEDRWGPSPFDPSFVAMQAQTFIDRFHRPVDASGGHLPTQAENVRPALIPGQAPAGHNELLIYWADIQPESIDARRQEEIDRLRLLGLSTEAGFGALARHTVNPGEMPPYRKRSF
jgi:hypothetical protein